MSERPNRQDDNKGLLFKRISIARIMIGEEMLKVDRIFVVESVMGRRYTIYFLFIIDHSADLWISLIQLCTMAQMAHYYFTIPNSEICTTNFGIRNSEL